jgi:hypothetical protein
MHFYARLKRNSSIYADWRAHSRLAGFIDGIFFKLRGFDFVTDKLEREHINKIRDRIDQAIELEAIAIEPIDQPIRRPRLKRH